MTPQELERALEHQVMDTHLSQDALRQIRSRTYKGERTVKRKMNMGLALALVLLMFSATALAAGSGILEIIDRLRNASPAVLPGGEAIFASGDQVWSDELVNYRIVGAACDGYALGLVVEATARSEDTLLLPGSCVSLQCYRYGSKPCVPDLGVAGHEWLTPEENFNLIHRYARENGYTRVALVSAGMLGISTGETAYIEYRDGKVTLFITCQAEGISGIYSDELPVNSRLYDTPESPYENVANMGLPFTLEVSAPLWEREVPLALDVPEYGLRIHRLNLTATLLGVYAEVGCTITDAEKAEGATMYPADAQGNIIGSGVLEMIPREVCTGAESHLFRMTFPAMEDVPELLHVQALDSHHRDRERVTIALPVE